MLITRFGQNANRSLTLTFFKEVSEFLKFPILQETLIYYMAGMMFIGHF
jgi:hypothetical protein